jgi:(p)ppGpp synthase/HD superfamily hydrolase
MNAVTPVDRADPGSLARVAGRVDGVSALSRAADELDSAYLAVTAKPGKGVAHAHVVAAVVRNVGCAEVVQVAGLLHDIVEDTAWTVAEVRERFGDDVGVLVAAVMEDDAIKGYQRRKRALRDQIARAGPSAIDIALADKVASLRHALTSECRVARRKLAHYEATLALAPSAGHPELAREAAELLLRVATRDAAAVGTA